MNSSLGLAPAEVKRLAAAGVLGFHTHVEAIEIFATRDGQMPFNIFSIFVAEERDDLPKTKSEYLGKRITLKLLKGWTFGIQRTILPIAALIQSLDTLQQTGEWKPSGTALRVGPVVPVPTQFVPPDSTTLAPWNHVLKNNFWSGSYVVELADPEKLELRPLIDNPLALQELSAVIGERIRMGVASLSDRLGNLVFQIPVSVIVTRFARDRTSGAATVDLAWHPKATPRPVRASCGLEYDNMISGYASADIQGTSALLPTAVGPGMQRGVIWDDQNKVILAATGGTALISKIAMGMRALNPEPRVFTLKDAEGKNVPVRVGLWNGSTTQIGPVTDERVEDWTRKRIYRDEAARLAAERVFVQYRPQAGAPDQHEKALEDLRVLINRHGEHGAWLWDPFLSADDILRTLFYCGHAGAQLRALTAAHSVPSPRPKASSKNWRSRLIGLAKDGWALLKAPAPPPTFAESQRAAFIAANSNLRGLRLEFRVRTGMAGWSFHDRFLIFPAKEGPALAWSLGTSVNSMGRQHHILQRVDDGQLVANAFDDLWSELNQPEHLIWKTP